MKWFYIGLFGLAGVYFRYAVGLFSEAILPPNFPWATFGVNLLGAFLTGILSAYAAQVPSLHPDLRIGLAVGFLGGFTTFSAYCVETLALLEGGKITLGLLYITASPVLGVVMAFGGALVVRRFYA